MKRILTCALASLICSSAFANEMNRLVISSEANKSGTYTVLKSSMIDSRIHFQKCVSKEMANFSGNNTLILEDCILIGRLDGYTEDEITSRL